MSSVVKKLSEKKLITPPKFLVNNTHYEVIMGSVAYGISNDNSDIDIYGFAIPSKEDIFPHLRGEILGFGTSMDRFEHFQLHHIADGDKEYDLTIYSIIKYFNLLMQNNPNIIDSLFVPTRCVLHCTAVGNIVRDNRKEFLHKGCWHKFKCYSYSSMHKMDNKRPECKRKQIAEEFGLDTKYAYHVVRLLNEVEQILVEGDLDLERNREQLKSIRRGEWTIDQIKEYFSEKEKQLEEAYIKSDLPYGPDEDKIKQLLLNCLEHHYGSLQNAIVIPGKTKSLIEEIQNVLDKYSS